MRLRDLQVIGFLLVFFVAAAFAQTKPSKKNIVLHPRGTPSFAVDYANGTFVLDGKPGFRYISGSVHYFRIHPSQWLDRLKRVRALGFNAIQFYIPWNFHEVEKGKYDFSEWRDFPHFIQLAAEQGLFTLLRLGPYACGEWENGGLPYWLIIDQPDIKQRSKDSRFTSAWSTYFAVLAEKVKPLLRQNGGPVLMVQIENEYGSYDACDHEYNIFLRDETWRLLGKETVIYTTDGGAEGFLKCGAVNGTLTTVDFGPTTKENIQKAFDAQKKYLPGGKGPLVNSEFYPGWLVLWGQRTQELPSVTAMIESAKNIYNAGASINFYMIYGGTNFGFWNGAEWNAPVITSYDYSAPITESGDYTSAYYAIRSWIKGIPGWRNQPTTPPTPIAAKTFPSVKLQLRPFADMGVACTTSLDPLPFEKISQQFGYVLYYTSLERCGTNLTIASVKDFGYVFLNEKRQGTFVKQFWKQRVNTVSLNPKDCEPGARLEILVENQGRQTYETINDYKGILSPVLIDGSPVSGWTQCTLEMPYEIQPATENRAPIEAPLMKPKALGDEAPYGIFYGSFIVDQPADTYVHLGGWGKGHVQLNGHNLGRYWSSQGPQYALYVPAALVKKGRNSVMVMEIEGATATACPSALKCNLKFSDHPDIHFDNVTLHDWHIRAPRKGWQWPAATKQNVF